MRAIASGDKAMVARANGVGPKLAQRIVMELKDKVGGIVLAPGSGGESPRRRGLARMRYPRCSTWAFVRPRPMPRWRPPKRNWGRAARRSMRWCGWRCGKPPSNARRRQGKTLPQQPRHARARRNARPDSPPPSPPWGACFARGAALVRGEHDMVHPAQRIGHVRLVGEHVQPRPGQPVRLQRGDERVFLDQAAACDIDEDAIRAQPLQHPASTTPRVSSPPVRRERARRSPPPASPDRGRSATPPASPTVRYRQSRRRTARRGGRWPGRSDPVRKSRSAARLPGGRAAPPNCPCAPPGRSPPPADRPPATARWRESATSSVSTSGVIAMRMPRAATASWSIPS